MSSADTGGTPAHATDQAPIRLAEQSWFFVGGRYVDGAGGRQRVDAMYVECYRPEQQSQPLPVVMIHGGVQTGSNFIATPDGRRGWLHDFLLAGYTVYVVDQPERGRSGHALGEAGTVPGLLRYSAEQVAGRFTAVARYGRWPQASRHSQWPGSGEPGDACFDSFFASQVEMSADRTLIEARFRDAGVALLDRIGPAVLLTHSQSGPFGWLLADARPSLVRAILALEPNGPPFRDVEFVDGPGGYRYADELARPYGLTRAPLTFDPPVAAAHELDPQLEAVTPGAEAAGRVPAWLPGVPRRLPNLAGIPILVMTAEASYHAPYDACTSRFLDRMGVAHEHCELAAHGQHGNGHMVMLERNNHAVADLMIAWLRRQTLG